MHARDDEDDERGLPLRVERPIPSATSSAFRRRAIKLAKALPVALLLLGTGGVAGMYFQPPGLKAVFSVTGLEPGGGTRDPVAVPADSKRAAEAARGKLRAGADVVGLGRLVPRGDVVVLSPPFGAGDARVQSLEVDVGERVEAGQVVALLDSLGERAAAVEIADAALAVRQATLAQTRSSVSSSRRQTQAALDRAKSVSDQAASDLARAETLFKDGIVTRAERDTARSLATQATQSVLEGQATLSRYSSKRKSSQADVLVATRNLESASAELERAKQELAKSQVTAPSEGVVLEIHTRPGEKPGSAGVVTLGDIDKMTAEVEVYQDLIGRVAVGNDVVLIAEALPKTLHGRVSRIGLQVARQSILDDDPAANTDARVITVYVALDPESVTAARPFTNLEVVARIDAGKRGT